jgi:teichuronic acid biosynthesis glycosyltransferase TuaC
LPQPDVRVLSLSTNYPRPGEKSRGLFVRSRLQHLSKVLPVKVVSPVAWIDYAAEQKVGKYPPVRLQDDNVEVFYPRWLYPPYGGVSNAWFLAARLLPYLRRLRREYPFTVMDSHFGYPEGIAAALLSAALAVPFTITLRGSELLHSKHAGRRWWMRWAFGRAGRIIAVSEELRRFAISQGVDADRVRTIPNGADADLFYPRPYADSRARLGMPAGVPVILTAGHLIELKGHHLVVRALAELRRQGSSAELWIVGGPGRVASFERQIREEVERNGVAGAVHFAGVVSQPVLAEYMSAADVFCLASSREGWPNVVHEALACGAPAVATDVGGIQDMLPSPEHGIIVPAGNQAELTMALGRALSRQWDRGRIAAWGKSRSWTQVAAETADVLREASGQPFERQV